MHAHPETPTVLVTGGAGFIGSQIADALVAAGHRVVVLDNFSTGRRENIRPGITVVEGDIRDQQLVAEVFRTHRPRWVSHHAAQTSVGRSVADPIEDAQVNLLGTLNLLAESETQGVENFVFASTGGAIYGEVPPQTQASSARCPANPATPYGCSKYAAEVYLRASRLNTTVLRYANVYGPRQNPKAEGGVVAIFASRLVRNSELAVFGRAQLGDGGGIRDYVYIRDVVQANLAAHRGQLQGQTLDISTGVGTTTSELAETLKSIVGGQSSIVSRPPREGDLQRSVVDPQPMIDQLGKPTTLRSGLTETVEWFALRTKREG